jgi:NAD(P)-dependent dehydrogenase (short-subunit alcohol dehydrogenase family)
MFVTPSFRLDGCRALVTGGSKGLGLAAACALAQAGAQVLVVARNAAELVAACASIDGACGNNDLKSSYAVLNVQDSAAVDALFANHGPFDVVVNNAGTSRPKLLAEASNDDLDVILDLNIKAAFYVARAAARSMLAAERRAKKAAA